MFTYDYQGRRVSKTVAFWDEGSSAWAVSSEHYYTYDGWNMICETTIAQISNPPSQVQRIQSFVWGLDLSGTLQGAGGVGGLLASVVDGAIYYSTYDANGNVSEMLDVSGQVTAHYQYGPFGEPITATGTYANENPFRFSTKYTDPETGLLYYGFRYYNPETGRWLSRDPIEEEGGLNLYGFVGNDGVNRWDLLGLAEIWTFSGINSWDSKRRRTYDTVNEALLGGNEDYQGKITWSPYGGSDVSMVSNLGTQSPYRDSSYPDLGSVKNLRSEFLLDREAQSFAAGKFLDGGELCCKTVRLLMISPKTTTRPVKQGCCDFEAVVYWSPHDRVPNQRPRVLQSESSRYWSDWGSVHTVDTRATRAPSTYGEHAFGAFIAENPSYSGTRQITGGPRNKNPSTAVEHIASGQNAPDPRTYLDRWNADSSVDIIGICHSQGCNIAMHVLNRGCTKR